MFLLQIAIIGAVLSALLVALALILFELLSPFAISRRICTNLRRRKFHGAQL